MKRPNYDYLASENDDEWWWWWSALLHNDARTKYERGHFRYLSLRILGFDSRPWPLRYSSSIDAVRTFNANSEDINKDENNDNSLQSLSDR